MIHTNTMIHRVSVRCSVSNVFDNLLKSFKVSVWAIQADIDSAPLVEDEAVGEELAELFYRVQGACNACSITDLITAEFEFPTCSEFADESWNDEFMVEIGPRSKDRFLSSYEEDDDAPADIEPSLPQLNTFREANLEDIGSFLEVKDHTTEATKTSDLGNDLAQLECSSSRYTVQLGIKSYFKPFVA